MLNLQTLIITLYINILYNKNKGIYTKLFL
jgi:hypothetical protein